MPIIKHLAQQMNAPIDGLPRLGKFHKGTPKQKKMRDGREYEVVGRDTDHFRVEFAEEYQHLTADFEELYGKRPKRLSVMLNADTALEALDFWYESWDGKGTLLRRCDGATQAICYNATTGFHEQGVACITPQCDCKQTGRMSVVLPDLILATGVMGTITVETHSDQDIRTLLARLTTYANLYGTLRGVPLILQRVMRDTSAPKTDKQGNRTGERTKIKRAMLDIQVDPDFAREKLMAAMSGAYSTRALPHAADVLVASPNAQNALGSGPRRLGAPQEQPALPAHWTADEGRGKGFFAWAAKYGQTPEEALRALTVAAQRPIDALSDFTGHEHLAMGAVMAYACEYKADVIKRWLVKDVSAEVAEAVRAHALTIAKAYQEMTAQPAPSPENTAATPTPDITPDADAQSAAAKDAFDIFPA